MPKMSPCVKCKKSVEHMEFYCHGCRAVVCEDCEAGFSVAAANLGPHEVEDHFAEHEDEEEY